MKVRLNKKVLKNMPEPVRNLVKDWKAKYRKSFISVENRNSFFVPENAHITVLNLLSGKSANARGAGDFAGHDGLRPTEEVPLPYGTVAVVEEIFLGKPMLTVYQSSANKNNLLNLE